MGDFNLDLIKVDTHNQTKDFVHSLYTNAFYPTISKHTRVTDHSATLLDNIIYIIIRHCSGVGAFPRPFCVPNSVALA